mgnify:CR=1 FL=1
MVALNGSPTWRIAQSVIELNHSDLDPHALAREKTDKVRSMLLDSVQPLPLVDVVKAWHGRRPMSVDHVQHHKPAPDTFLLCAERMGVVPARCVVFEDADFGIQAAHAAGMDAVDVRLL